MDFQGTLHSASLRLRRLQSWVAVAAFGLPFMVLRLFFFKDYLGSPAILISSCLMPYLMSGAFGWIAPAAWRWTGDGRPSAGFLRALGQSALLNSALTLVLVVIDYLLIMSIKPKAPVPFRHALAVNLVFMVPMMTLVGYFITSAELMGEERQRADLQAKEARDRALQKQLSPHVLFNALNGLAELVRQDPVRAEQGLLDLADLYRRVLDHGQLQWAPLQDERLLVERFLAVEHLRLGERLHVIWCWDDTVERLMVPPLLIQPLVENAIKHGAGRRPGVFKVYITAHRVLGQLEVTVENEGALEVRGGRQGIGLRNIQQRLALHFPGEAETLLETADGFVKAGFRISERALGVRGRPAHGGTHA